MTDSFSHTPNKHLGQHFLFDKKILHDIIIPAELSANDTVLEIGPGLGTLTAELLATGANVIVVEFDRELAQNLKKKIEKGSNNLTVITGDFLQFNLNNVPENYKIVANIPYNITSPIIEKILTSENRPQIAVLLIQKEVARRIIAAPGDLSVLAIRTQIFAETNLGIEVPPEKFTPPPEVDSQVLVLTPRPKNLITTFCENENITDETAFTKTFWRLINAGFANKRKKLRTSLAPAFSKTKPETENFLRQNNLDPNLRAQDVAIAQWLRLAQNS
jgi:16S rRNA (adenine1518-N6/adenine1519-N6)-dimethyltransferase